MAAKLVDLSSEKYSTSDSSKIMTKPNGMNHKAWKAYLKKIKRKEKRQAVAIERENLKGEQHVLSTDSEEEREKEREEAERQRQNQLWLERERQAQLAFQAKKEWEEKEKKRKEEVERKIREEWEERECREKEEQEKKEKQEQEKRLKQDKLLKEATANENTDAWHNPFAPVQFIQERQVEHCPFFKKTAACRFGDHCSRYHDYPEISTTLLIPSMFSSFELEQSIVDNIDTDVSLEYDDNELYQSFKEFYEDVVPELKTVGTVVQLKVCCNCEPHLRGNVYVQFKRESVARKAYEKFNARWYGGRQLTCTFVNIESWKSAICGLAFKKRCPKGKSCNFLHVFRNPGGEFTEMDFDGYNRFVENNSQQNHKGDNKDRSRGGDSLRSNRSRRRSRTRSPDMSSKVRHRSRSRSERARRRSRSRSRGKISKSHHRSRSRSPSTVPKSHRRSRSRSPNTISRSDRRSRSRSPRTKSKSHHRSRSRSPSTISRSHRRSRSRSPGTISRSHRRSRSKSPSRIFKSHHRSRTRSKLGSKVYKSRSRSPAPSKLSRSKRRSKSQSSNSLSNSPESTKPSPSSESSTLPNHASPSPNEQSDFNQNIRPLFPDRKDKLSSPNQTLDASDHRSPHSNRETLSTDPSFVYASKDTCGAQNGSSDFLKQGQTESCMFYRTKSGSTSPLINTFNPSSDENKTFSKSRSSSKSSSSSESIAKPESSTTYHEKKRKKRKQSRGSKLKPARKERSGIDSSDSEEFEYVEVTREAFIK